MPAEDLKKKLATRRPLTVKLGLDPTSPDIHLGHAVVLRKLREFQDFGHNVVLIVGDFTAKIGDPSGRSKTRPVLSDAEIKKNATTYKQQALKILDPKRLTVRFNSEWLKKLKLDEILELMGTSTVAQMLSREDFSRRNKEGNVIGLHELLYPLMQAMDSVAVRADVELGGTDQTFNLLAGRELQARGKKEPQVIMTMPLLVGTDGVKKMSKSLGNYVGVMDEPAEMYGKVMSLPDQSIPEYLRLASSFSDGAIQEMLDGIKQGGNPMEVKKKLAADIVQRYWTEKDAQQAASAFTATFSNKEFPGDAPGIVLRAPADILTLLVEHNILPSRSEARRKIAEGAVTLDGSKVTDIQCIVQPSPEHSLELRVGKKGFYRVTRQ